MFKLIVFTKEDKHSLYVVYKETAGILDKIYSSKVENYLMFPSNFMENYSLEYYFLLCLS